jgi:uncharacterized membrane protein YccC
MHPRQWLDWLARHDRNHAALRRAARTAIVMPALFAVGDKVIKNSDVATFAAFGSFALLLLVDFTGPIRDRVRAQAALALVGAVFVGLGTVCSQHVWLAALSMAVVGFGVLFAGIVSSTLAAASTSLLLSFILPVSLREPVSTVPDRLAGWAMASAVSVVAVGLLWPAPVREPLRRAATAACRALAARLRSEVTAVLDPDDAALQADFEDAVRRAGEATAAVRQVFLATPYRPTGLNTAARTVVRLVDELSWLDAVVNASSPALHPRGPDGRPILNPAVRDVKIAVCDVLERGADLLDVTGGDPAPLAAATGRLRTALAAMEDAATTHLPVRRLEADDGAVDEFVTSLDPGFRAQELSFAVTGIARNIELTAAAERRTWPQRLLGRRVEGLSGQLSAAQERATSHVEWHSVWLHNSLRGAIGLGLAVAAAAETGVQHSFWVVLGTLSVLRSNALSTGQNALRGLAGTILGVVVGGLLVAAIGTDATLLWFLLPVAVLVAGVAPAVVSFAAGQAGFTLTLVILFNIIQPVGWKIGLLRIEDIAIGCAVSLVVGLLFWPRGARTVLRSALAEAYTDTAGYLAGAVAFGMSRCDTTSPPVPVPAAGAARSASASRRLDDAFRGYLAETGAKPLPLAVVAQLVSGVAGVRLAADAVLELWQCDDQPGGGDRQAARQELLSSTRLLQDWYAGLAAALTGRGAPPVPLEHDKVADGRLVSAVRKDLRGRDGRASADAVRMIWTADHLDAVRRLQSGLAPALERLGAETAKAPA